jgi:hypothetical protein
MSGRDMGWLSRAACRGKVKKFFPGQGGGGLNAAREICGECPVQIECLEYGIYLRSRGLISNGLWGGLTVDQLPVAPVSGRQCANPGCQQSVPLSLSSRLRRYCSTRCVRAVERERHRKGQIARGLQRRVVREQARAMGL